MLRHLSLLYFYKFINRKIVGNNEFDKTCVLYSPLQLLSETFLIPVRNQQDIITNVLSSSHKVADIFVQFQTCLNFLFNKIRQCDSS